METKFVKIYNDDMIKLEDFTSCVTEYNAKLSKLEEENKKLKEFKDKIEENRFYFKAQMELLKPKTAREAEYLQKAKKIYEELFMNELKCLEEENKKLKEEIEYLKFGWLEKFYSK